MERATALFVDCSGDVDALLLAHASEIETVVGGEAFHASTMLGWTTLEIAGVTDASGQRSALLTIVRPAYDGDGGDDGLDPLLDAAIEASPAIVWLKDLDGRYLRVNREYVDQLRTSVDRVRGKTDSELEPGESIEGLRSQSTGKPAKEPLELEYMVDAAGDLPAFAVVRFALRDVDGKPSALCGVAAALARAEVARSECRRFMRLARWRGSDESAIRAGLIAEWGLKLLGPSDGARSGRPRPERDTTEADGDQFAALAGELDAALETSARLDQELAEERRQVIVLREASVLSARRAQELLRSVTAERVRTAELEESLARADGRATELERERDSERSRADRAEGVTADALAHEHEIAETLRAELAASREQLERLQAAAREAPTPAQLEVERAEAHKAKLAAEQAQAEVASTSAALVREQRTVETLRDELRAAEEEAGRVRRAASEAAAEAPTQDELEQERRRADRANADLTRLRARAEMSEAEAKSVLAQARSELRRCNEEAAAASDALTGEKQHVASLRDELTELSDELEATRRELAERPTTKELEQERSRTEWEHARAEQQLGRAQQAEASAEGARREMSALAATNAELQHAAEHQPGERLHSELAVLQAELERARRELAERPTSEELERERSRAQHEAGESLDLLAAERQTVEALCRELATAHAELERIPHAAPVPEGQTPASSEELERAQMRAERAEAALHDQRVIADQAAASAEEERMKAAAASAAAEAERDTAESLRAELSAAQAELERGHSEARATEIGGSNHDTEDAQFHPAALGSPVWQPVSQRALSAALTAVDDWRTALKQTVKIVGHEGKWDAVAAWSPDRRRKLMQCVAMWGAEATISSAFETWVWQHRPKLPDERGAWRPPAPATSFVDLETAEDALLRAAAGEGIGSAVLVPIHDGAGLVGTLQLMSRNTTPPTAELMLSLEGVALQLATIARLLEASGTPHWRVAGL
ncbi:MAG TPA: PAS domain-containing protein [Solirubrobacteraceae bacterium]|nr:PAS domain-containing protein [Solirubrobacteraceae bacterium]